MTATATENILIAIAREVVTFQVSFFDSSVMQRVNTPYIQICSGGSRNAWGAQVTKAASSQVPMLSRPNVVFEAIRKAAALCNGH